MKIFLFAKRNAGFTLIELVVVVALLGILFLMFDVGGMSNAKPRAQRVLCINNLKQTGLAFSVWANDHEGQFPMQVSTNAGGTMEWIEGPNAFRHFEAMSNELNTPKILFCPAETDASRVQATIFWGLNPAIGDQLPFANNLNLSYFLGVDATKTNAMMFLAGDHNLTNGAPVRNGLLELTAPRPAGWTEGLHRMQGNVGLADGSVQTFSRQNVRDALEHTGVRTNRLAMP